MLARLADGARPEDCTRWGRPGIRAQLVDVEKRALIAMPFAAHAADRIERR